VLLNLKNDLSLAAKICSRICRIVIKITAVAINGARLFALVDKAKGLITKVIAKSL